MASTYLLPLLVLCILSMAQSDLRVFNLRATDLPSDVFGITDGYVKVYCDATSLGTTATRDDEINPWWAEEFASFVAQENSILTLEVHDSDLFFDDLVGTCQRQIKLGTHEHDCYLKEGGTLHYAYTLN
ncbi:perforin-1-like [Chaetodon trifascialis]|uniref:perforin-1-like n=1 Tax=Chaetodon trifascialis TaxID=109706 RepID=UPI00399448CC